MLNPSHSYRCNRKLLLRLYLHFMPFWLQAVELNETFSSAFTIFVRPLWIFIYSSCIEYFVYGECFVGFCFVLYFCLFGEFGVPACIKRV